VARITVEDCLKNVPNRFLLVNMVAKRVRQIREGSEYLVIHSILCPAGRASQRANSLTYFFVSF
jgi:DNA-directed RNA polymerase omega subunit